MKKLLSLAVMAALLVGLTVAPTFAADKKDKPTPEEAFKKMDKNADGKVSLEEFKGKRDGDKAAAAEKRFKMLDKDSDGSLTLDEFKAAAKKAK